MDLLPGLKEKADDLSTRIASLELEAKPLREQMGNLDRTKSKLAAELATVKDKISVLSAKPRVSDHVVIRYLERRHNFSFEDIRSQILTPTVVAAIRAGCESVKTADGTLRIKGNTVVTFVD